LILIVITVLKKSQKLLYFS